MNIARFSVENRMFVNLLCFVLIVGGLYCFTLPHTPPQKATRERRAAIWQAVKLMRIPSFAALIVASFVLTIFFQIYFWLNGPFITEARHVLAAGEGRWRVHVEGTVPVWRRRIPSTRRARSSPIPTRTP